jgi:cytochrome c oxidase subunit 2
VRAPRLEGIYNKPIPVQLPPAGLTGQALINALPKIKAETVIADDTYIHDSIALPEKAIAGGFTPIMPAFKNRLTEQEIFDLTAYIKSLGTTTVLEDEGITQPKRLSEEDYRARTGFVPENIKSLTDRSGAKRP